MNYFPTVVALLFILATNLCGNEVRVLLNPNDRNVADALIVLFPNVVTASKGQNTLRYKIINRSTEDIFVVTASERVAGWDEIKGPAGSMNGGGKATYPASTHEDLRLLFSPQRSSDGSLTSGTDAMTAETYAEVIVDCGLQEDLSGWIGAKGILRLRLKFYVGSSKGYRAETILVPIEIQPEGEQAASCNH